MHKLMNGPNGFEEFSTGLLQKNGYSLVQLRRGAALIDFADELPQLRQDFLSAPRIGIIPECWILCMRFIFRMQHGTKKFVRKVVLPGALPERCPSDFVKETFVDFICCV